MKRRTPRNMHKAVQMIMAKGYAHEEANEIAIRVFNEYEQWSGGREVEWFLDRIITKAEYEEQYGRRKVC